jgi:adenylate cyclase
MSRYLTTFKRHAWQIVFSLVIIGVFHVNVTHPLGWDFINRLERIAYDARLVLTMPGDRDERIVIVDIDEKSLAELGRWPWPRKQLATLLDRLFEDYNIWVLGMDVVFAEHDVSSGLPVLEKMAGDELKDVPQFQQRLETLRSELDNDLLFANSMRNRPVILGYYFSTEAEGGKAISTGQLPTPVFDKSILQGKAANIQRAVGYGANLTELQNAAMSGGHFTPAIDIDGVVRRVPLIFEYNGDYYEALSLAMARYILAVDNIVPNFETYNSDSDQRELIKLESLQIDSYSIPVDENAYTLIPYRGRKGSFSYISAADVIAKRTEPADLEGAIVLLGTSAPGLLDLRSTPVQRAYPGVEIHANLISGVLDESIKSEPPYVQGMEVIMLLCIGLVLTLLLPISNPLSAVIISTLVLVMTIAANLYFWIDKNLVIPIAHSLLLILLLFLLNMVFGYFIETRRKRAITHQFGRYVPRELVKEMSISPENFTLEGQSREMTVLFADIRNFTTISEGLDPKDLTQMMNEFFTPMTRIIHQHRGTIDKYIGDMVMAFWGAPLEDPDHARHAVEAGLAMQERLKQIRLVFKLRGWPEIHIGIGINTGVMSVGNMGSEFRVAYTVMGDAVNLGSRLESLTKQYGVSFVVSEFTMARTDNFLYRELDRVRVKGKAEPIRIYEPIGPLANQGPEILSDIELFHQALEHYQAQAWDQAQACLEQLQQQAPCQLYRMYLDRIQTFRQQPPPADWDGVFTFQTK